eukprot:4942795-Pyramimonas_sp.AAC.1
MPRTCKGCAEVEAAVPCESCHWGLRWNSLRCREACKACAAMKAAPCAPCHCGLRRSSFMGPRSV